MIGFLIPLALVSVAQGYLKDDPAAYQDLYLQYSDYFGEPKIFEDADVEARITPRSLHEDNAGKGKHGMKNSLLPAYCDPPNPCPPGYGHQDGCLEEFENRAEFSRKFQASQSCMCDTEHMFSCPDDSLNLYGDKEESLLAELSPFVDMSEQNPFMVGNKLPVAAKKGIY